MTPLQANAPQTVLDLLFPPGEDSYVAVVPDLLPPGASEDLDRALQNIPATLRKAAVRETTGAAKDLLNADPIGFLVSGWQKHREVIAAARRTVAAPGIIELVDLATHQITVTQRPAVNLLVDNRQTATVELGLTVVFTISALVAGSGEAGSSPSTPAAATPRPPCPSRTPRSSAGRLSSNCRASSRLGGESPCCPITTTRPTRATRLRRRQWPDDGGAAALGLGS